jgi:alkaline phosphatase D
VRGFADFPLARLERFPHYASRMSQPISRRKFALLASAGALAAPAAFRRAIAVPAIINESRPMITHGIASGDVSFDSAIVWSRCDRPARMLVEWSTTESFRDIHRARGPATNARKDYTAKLELKRLPAGERIFYRVRFEDQGGKSVSEAVTGQFVTAARDERDVFFAWSGDTCGQGYGIDESRGGLLTYAAMEKMRPDFFIHSGDTIYGDGVLQREVKLPDGTVWKNLITEEKSKVAETLAEFRGNYRYNLLDKNVRSFNAAVPMFAQWDDHEVRNNWYPGQQLEERLYTIKDVDTLARNSREAFFDYMPLRPNWRGRIFRKISRGPLCDIFMLDLRTYRGPNTPNRQPARSRETAFFGDAQLAWIKRELRASKAVWKIIASDMPIGLIVGDGKNFENCANGNGPALGRELEIAELLSHIRKSGIRNVIWLTADVHFAASYYYDAAKAQFSDFDPFWEFISGPLHAASLGPGTLDNTFGPQTRFTSRPKGTKASGPYTNQQYFSTVRIDGKTKAAMVSHFNRDGDKLWTIDLPAELKKSLR